MFHKRVIFKGGEGPDWTTLTSTLIQGAPKLMSTSAPRVSDLLDTPLSMNYEGN